MHLLQPTGVAVEVRLVSLERRRGKTFFDSAVSQIRPYGSRKGCLAEHCANDTIQAIVFETIWSIFGLETSPEAGK